MNCEPNLVIGCYLCDIDPKGLFTTKAIREYIDKLYKEHQIQYYDDCGFIGFKVDCEQRLTISSVQKLSKVANKFRSITGQVATVKACIHHVLEEE
jgi:hypothetical protein